MRDRWIGKRDGDAYVDDAAAGSDHLLDRLDRHEAQQVEERPEAAVQVLRLRRLVKVANEFGRTVALERAELRAQKQLPYSE
jgi:hypothetical protein